MATTPTILFVCPHNAAKSLLAAAEFDRLARARGLPLRAVTTGTEPAAGPAPAVVAALTAEGVDVSNHRPRRVTAADLAAAVRVVSLGCEPGELLPPGVALDRWDDVPPASADLAAARAAIRRHVAALVDGLGRDARV